MAVLGVARDIPIGWALIANPIRRRLNGNALANRFIERGTIGRDAVKRISRLSRNKRDTNRIEAIIDRSSNSRFVQTGIFP